MKLDFDSVIYYHVQSPNSREIVQVELLITGT